MAANSFESCYPIVLLVPDGLVEQTKVMIAPFCSKPVTIMGYREFYRTKPLYSVVFIDEDDQFFEEVCLWAESETEMHGIFSLSDPQYGRLSGKEQATPFRKTIVGFSATGNEALENLAQTIVDPKAKLVQLQSEFWCHTGKTNIDATFEGVDDTYVATITKVALLDPSKQPIIVFLEDDKVEAFSKHCVEKGYKVYDHVNIPHLFTVSSGILIMTRSQIRGYNTKFKVPAHVIIQFQLRTEAEFIQAMGRSNRARGINIGTVFFV